MGGGSHFKKGLINIELHVNGKDMRWMVVEV